MSMAPFAFFPVVNTIVGFPSVRIRLVAGIFPFRSIVTRSGFFPCQSRVVREGLSSIMVFVPAIIASYSERSLCTSAAVAGVENFSGLSSGLRSRSIIRSLLSAHFNNKYGRWSVWAVMNFLFNSRHSCSSMPHSTSHPASRSILIPLPLTSLKGSAHPITMRGMPLRIMSSLHGGVLP